MPRFSAQAIAALLLCSVAAAAARRLHAAAAQTGAPAKLGTTPVAFEGSALLVNYYAGVADALLQAGVIVPGTTSTSGLSGGAINLALVQLGFNGSELRAVWNGAIGNCVEIGGCQGRLNAQMEAALDGTVLPDDAPAKVNGLLRVAVSQLNASSTSLNDSASWVVDQFESALDLKSALTSTDYIPCWTGTTTYTIFRNQPVIDGGYANGFKQLCPNGDVENCIKAASWVTGPKANNTCDPGVCDADAVASGCKSSDRTTIVEKLYPNNYTYVDEWPLWKVDQRCPTDLYKGLAPNPMPDFVPHDQVTPDIYPGKYGPLPDWNGRPLLGCEWKSWSMALPKGQELEAMDVIYEQGLSDGLAWAAEQGLATSAY